MKPSRWTVPFWALAALTLSAATCNKGSNPPAAAPSPTAQARPKPPAPPPAPPVVLDGRSAALLSEIPGMDFSSLPGAAQRELATVFTDEFCYCGCPHTLGACLKTHPGCRHARRMASLAADEAGAGVPAAETLVTLGKYYGSFREKRAQFKPDERQCLGAPDAKIVLVEFSDFECPFCAAALPVLKSFAKANASRVRLCYLPFPLEKTHPNAILAGQAALFARDQGKFWEMHDLLFENQMSLSRGYIKGLASQLGLDAAALDKAFTDGKYVDELNAAKAAGKAAGVESTPSVYVNGRKFSLPLASDTLAHTTDDELEWVENNSAWAAD